MTETTTYPATVIAEFSADIGGSHYLVIYGTHINGGFCCIPNWNFSCELGDADDVAFNTERLERPFGHDTAQALAELIKTTVTEVLAKNIMAKRWKELMPDLSQRAQNSIRNNDHPMRGGKALHTVGDIASMDIQEIYAMRNIGQKTRREIALKLKELGVAKTAWYEFLPSAGNTDKASPSPSPRKPKKTPTPHLPAPTDTMAQHRRMMEKYFNEPAEREKWEGWNDKMIGQVVTQLAVMEMSGPIPEEYIARLKKALTDSPAYAFYELNKELNRVAEEIYRPVR